jgi:hypothetical protein
MRVDAQRHFRRCPAAANGWIDDAMASIRRDFLSAENKAESGPVAVEAFHLTRPRN